MKCTSCKGEIDLLSAVEHSARSWPALQTILHICPQCSARLYLHLETDAFHLLRPEAMLGPRKWTYAASEPCKNLTVRSAPNGLGVQIGRAKYLVVPSR
jgi:hypothetical protein